MLNVSNIKNALNNINSEPFDHCIIDDFFEEEIANSLLQEFPEYNSNIWYSYENALEVNKSCNSWNAFPETTYKVFSYLNSDKFIKLVNSFNKQILISSDPGLNGGGWHIYPRGGKLNVHLDYSTHPKLKLQRKLNIIVYLNKGWEKDWGGGLGLYANKSKNEPGELVKSIKPKFNRAIIFDTTQNSWHGLPNEIECPIDKFRKSLAIYYLCEPPEKIDNRGKALFAPHGDQKQDKSVIELIKKRAGIQTAHKAYRSKK